MQVADLFDKYDEDGNGELDIPEISRLLLESDVSSTSLLYVRGSAMKDNKKYRYVHFADRNKKFSWKRAGSRCPLFRIPLPTLDS